MIYILTFIGFWMMWDKLGKLERRIQELEVGSILNNEPNEKLREAVERYRQYSQEINKR